MKTNKFFLIIITLFLALSGCQIQNNQNKTGVVADIGSQINQHIPYELDLIMVGDALLHPPVYLDSKRNGQYHLEELFEPVQTMFKNYDLSFYNQEVILGGKEFGHLGYPQFNGPTEFGDYMIDELGFNLVSLANNHSLDMGVQGILNSNEYWNNKAAITAGTYSSKEAAEATYIYQKNGISFGFLSYTESLNGLRMPEDMPYLVNVYSDEKVKEDVEKIREKVDLLIVNIHAGDEYVHYPNENQKHIAQTLSKLGVDIMIGQHPHVIQPIEWIGDMLAVYSLGNFVSGQIGEERLTELVVAVDIKKENSNEIVIDNVRADLLYQYYDPGFTNFKLYRLQEVPENKLANKDEIFKKYQQIVQAYDSTIRMENLKK